MCVPSAVAPPPRTSPARAVATTEAVRSSRSTSSENRRFPTHFSAVRSHLWRGDFVLFGVACCGRLLLDSGSYLNMRIALDVMGGDKAPQAIMAGAVEALEAFGGDLQKLFLVGDEGVIQRELRDLSYAHGKIEIVHASEVVTMTDS